MMTASICTSSSYFEHNCQDQTIQLWQEMTPTLSFYLSLNLMNFTRTNSHCRSVESKEAIHSADFFSNSSQWLAGWFVVCYDAGLSRCHWRVLNVLFLVNMSIHIIVFIQLFKRKNVITFIVPIPTISLSWNLYCYLPEFFDAHNNQSKLSLYFTSCPYLTLIVCFDFDVLILAHFEKKKTIWWQDCCSRYT